MHNRLRLMQGATALLYLGPLIAGLGGFGWRIVPVFVAIFLMWTLILRPSTWPQSRADWSRPDLLVALLAQSLVQVLLVVLCFGIGRGLGGAFGTLPPIPVLLPISISFAAIPLCRLIWNPKQAEAMDRFLDTALAGITAVSAGTPHVRSDAHALTAHLLTPLQALPDTTPDAEITRHLTAIATHADPADIAHVLLSAAESGTASRPGLRALILHVTDPYHTDRLLDLQLQTRTFSLIADDAALALLFARRGLAQLQDDPAAWGDSVNPETLRHQAAIAHPDTAAALHALAELTQSLTPPDPFTDSHARADAPHAPH